MDASPVVVEYVPADTLTPHPQNPRQGDVGAIHASLVRHGPYKPLVVQRSTRRILAGNHLYAALVAAGARMVPVVWRDVDDAEALALLVDDNETSARGTTDREALAAILQSLPDLEEMSIFDGDDLDALLADAVPLTDPAVVSLPGTCCPRCGYTLES